MYKQQDYSCGVSAKEKLMATKCMYLKGKFGLCLDPCFYIYHKEINF
jgi:hypothetical protein